MTTIDAIFAAVAETPEARRAKDHRDRQTALYVLSIGMVVLVIASVGAAVLLRELIHVISGFLV